MRVYIIELVFKSCYYLNKKLASEPEFKSKFKSLHINIKIRSTKKYKGVWERGLGGKANNQYQITHSLQVAKLKATANKYEVPSFYSEGRNGRGRREEGQRQGRRRKRNQKRERKGYIQTTSFIRHPNIPSTPHFILFFLPFLPSLILSFPKFTRNQFPPPLSPDLLSSITRYIYSLSAQWPTA